MSQTSANFTLGQTTGKHDIKMLKRELDHLPGVTSVSINDTSIAVDFDSTGVEQQQLQHQIEKLGFTVQDARAETRLR